MDPTHPCQLFIDRCNLWGLLTAGYPIISSNPASMLLKLEPLYLMNSSWMPREVPQSGDDVFYCFDLHHFTTPSLSTLWYDVGGWERTRLEMYFLPSIKWTHSVTSSTILWVLHDNISVCDPKSLEMHSGGHDHNNLEVVIGRGLR